MTKPTVRAMPLWNRLMFGASFGLVSSRKIRSMPVWTRLLFAATVVLAAVMLYRSVRAEIHRNSVKAVGLTGSQHIGPDFNIAGFYVDGFDGSNVGREGGGGGEVCCVLLPKKWRSGLVVEVRWAVGDWTKENREEINAQNYRSIKYTCFKAVVPVERYETAERVFVHFFSGGKVRVVSSFPGPGNPAHPILDDDPNAADTATLGKRVDAIFTDAELAEMEQRHENRSTFFGDW